MDLLLYTRGKLFHVPPSCRVWAFVNHTLLGVGLLHLCWPWNTGSELGMNTAYALADCSRDYPRRERPGVKTRRSGLCQCSVLGKIDQRKFCSLQSEIKAGLRVDSAPQPNRGCTRFCVLFPFLLLAPGPLGQQWAPNVGLERKWKYSDSKERPLKILAGKSSGI